MKCALTTSVITPPLFSRTRGFGRKNLRLAGIAGFPVQDGVRVRFGGLLLRSLSLSRESMDAWLGSKTILC